MKKQNFTFKSDIGLEKVFKAFVDPEILQQWRSPDDMEMQIHLFEPKVDGKFRVSLKYHDPSIAGKSGQQIDTYHGYFKELIPNKKIVEVIQFESDQAELLSDMIVTTQFSKDGSGTLIEAIHENLPEGISAKDNEVGWKMSFEKLRKILLTRDI